MRLAMIDDHDGPHSAAFIGEERLVDLRQAANAGVLRLTPTCTVVDILSDATASAGVRRLIQDIAANAPGLLDRLRAARAILQHGDARMLAPVRPLLILCTGGTYREHLKEMGAAMPSLPRSFLKSPYALNGPFSPIVLPRSMPEKIDFECELTCVFKRSCHGVSAEEAMDYIGGYTMINDVSARDDVAGYLAAVAARDVGAAGEAWDRVLLGKQFPTFCPIGPVVATADEIGDPHAIDIQTRVNGVVMQSANTRDLAFRLAETIAHFSRYHRFEPGDVLSTGSPPGVGVARNPPLFLKVGDVVEVAGEGIGTLRNTVIAAA